MAGIKYFLRHRCTSGMMFSHFKVESAGRGGGFLITEPCGGPEVLERSSITLLFGLVCIRSGYVDTVYI